jgi:ssDNA-binding Zn-finger/Zn-ribbon topoisomerase 1
MMKADAICPECNAGFRRMELSTRRGMKGEYRCPICDQLIETFDGSTEIAYRLTITPVKARAEKAGRLA